MPRQGENSTTTYSRDVLNSSKYLRENRFGLILKAQRENWEDQDQCDEVELVSADLSDTYCRLAVHENELGNIGQLRGAFSEPR